MRSVLPGSWSPNQFYRFNEASGRPMEGSHRWEKRFMRLGVSRSMGTDQNSDHDGAVRTNPGSGGEWRRFGLCLVGKVSETFIN